MIQPSNKSPDHQRYAKWGPREKESREGSRGKKIGFEKESE